MEKELTTTQQAWKEKLEDRKKDHQEPPEPMPENWEPQDHVPPRE